MQFTSFLGSTAPAALKARNSGRREAQKTERARVKKIAARYTVAEMDFFVSVKPKHRVLPP